MRQLAKKDYAFADYLAPRPHTPQGPTLSVNFTPTHDLVENHENPEQFNAFRFAKMRLQKDGKKVDVVATSQTFLFNRTSSFPTRLASLR